MSIENSSNIDEELTPQDKKRIEQYEEYDNPRKILHDYTNAFSHLSFIQNNPAFPIEPIETYEARYRRKESKAVADWIMNQSDPNAVATIDRFITEFNADLKRINKKKDLKAIKKFLDAALKIVKGEQ